MSSQISAAKAKEYINNYREGLPAGSMRSAWIDRSFIDAIFSLSETHRLNGVRIYLARYTENISHGVFSAGEDGDTMIIVPTEGDNPDSGQDVEDGYYDYAHICPPHCDGDAGNQ